MTGMDTARTGDLRPPSRRTVRRAFGPRRVLPSVVTAALLTAAAVILAVEVIGALLGRPPGVLPVAELTRLGQNLRWDDILVLATASLLAALGLWLLLLALRPGRLRAIPLRSDDTNVVLGIATLAPLHRPHLHVTVRHRED